MPRIYVGPTAERELADSGSEGTLCVVLAVTAAIAAYQAGPQVHHRAVDAGEGNQHPREDRATTPAHPSDVQHGHIKSTRPAAPCLHLRLGLRLSRVLAERPARERMACARGVSAAVGAVGERPSGCLR